MKIGGLQKVSLIDFPEHIAAVVFTQGCPWRCQYCHNPSLVEPECFSTPIPEEEVFAYLKDRIGKLDGVVVTGGEPTLHADLPEFLKKIRALGFKIKLDTNGAFPDRLKGVLEAGLVDYIAMDLKCAFDKYETVVGAQVDIPALEKSVEIIRASGLPYEWRTTVVPQLGIDPAEIAKHIRPEERYFLQGFRAAETVRNKELCATCDPAMKGKILKDVEKQGINAQWR